MNFNVISIMPDFIEQGLSHGVVGAAFKKELCFLNLINPRQFTTDTHQTVDDRPFGGGDGMLMMAEPLQLALDSVSEKGKILYLSPQGKPLNNKMASELADKPSLTLICGRYGGIDQRFLNKNDIEEVSIGDYVLSGGELAALVLIDACTRKRPGVLGHSASASEDSFENGLLEAPYYTRPQEWGGQKVPEILLNGDHKKIDHFKNQLSILLTLQKRPELLDLWSDDLSDSLSFLLNLSELDLKVLGLNKDLVQKRLEERING